MIEHQAKFDFVRYANCWEDADVLTSALAPSAAGRNLLSIASAGDNVLALLTLAPKRIVAVDLSTPQLACLELRIAAFRELEHEELLAFLGLRCALGRVATYRCLRGQLSATARGFWDAHESDIENGIVTVGKFERYLALFRRWCLPLVHHDDAVEELLRRKSAEERDRFYVERWDSWRWQLVFQVFFSRAVMGHLGRDPTFFEQAEGSVASRLLARAHHAVTQLDTSDNPYLEFILTGTFRRALPRYLQPEHHATIRERLDSIEIVHGSLGEVRGRFAGFNLSDVFEYMSPQEFAGAAQHLRSLAEDGAIFAYWNMLVPRRLGAVAPMSYESNPSLSRRLHAQDRAFFYSAFHVERACS
jgi:S-adenosylmethionine-diacylglycerol 3-amino-3-carboxypropyl transferase